jgi:flagellar basal body rod protein FlgG
MGNARNSRVNLSLFENASALRGLEQYQNIIANNIAASHVAGFKKVAVSFEAVEGGEIARSTHDRLRNEMPGSFPVMKNQVDYHEGEMKETNNPMDMALRGDGFFSLMNNNGDAVYTRDGQFYIDADGVMVNSMGHQFADAGGNVIQTLPGGGDLTIDKEGLIFQDGQNIAQVGVFVFQDPLMNLQKVGGGFIAKEDGVEPELAEVDQFTLMQGYLESSNVSAIQEMIGLIEVSRAHEANQKMIQAFDQNIGKAIGTLGQTQ